MIKNDNDNNKSFKKKSKKKKTVFFGDLNIFMNKKKKDPILH